jgi:prophage regulatory protein
MLANLAQSEAPARSRPRRLLSYDDLRERGIKLSKLQLWRMARDGKFPKPVKLSHSRNAWVEAEVDKWLDALVENRSAEVSHG